ncbi:MAG TPA: helicase C-terminal domain-containing protein [Micromonosporaceae bacterium]
MATTLADHLRALPDHDLGTLLRQRPDLVVPVPADVSTLAARAQSRLSVARALDGLDRFTLEVLDGLRLSRDADGQTASMGTLLSMTSVGDKAPDAGQVRAAVRRLVDLAVVYGPDDAMHIVPGVDEVCSPYPAGLGRPAASLDAGVGALCADAAGLRRTVLAAPPAARAVLDRLAVGPPLGSVTPGVLADPDSPVGWLVSHQLLVPVTNDAVELPREVGLLLRRRSGGGPLGHLHPTAPEPEVAVREPKVADSAGAGQAMEVVRQVEALLEEIAAQPPVALRVGGLGVRDLKRLSRAVNLPDSTVAVLLEVAVAAGLLAIDEAGTGESGYLPTVAYDAWRVESLPVRWVRLARAYLAMPRQPGLVGRRDERDRPIAALSTEVRRINAPGIRLAALRVLADAPPGGAVSGDDVLATLAWHAPRRYPWHPGGPESARTEQVRWALAEAALLGLTGLGALTGYARLLLAEVTGAHDENADPLGILADPDDRRVPGCVVALDALLPAPVDHVLIQADLTVVVPGPPEPTLASELALVADPESAGGASVYRVTPDSVRRALDAGYLAADLHKLFARRSRTPVPQALSYLVDDVARRHGGLRAGSAGGYLRCEDEALLTELIADRRVAPLQLRRLAPTVVISPYSPGRMLTALRDAGYAPVPEDASGAAVLTRPKVRRAAARPALDTPVVDPVAPKLTGARLAGLVEEIRRGDAAARAARRAPVSVRTVSRDPQAHSEALAILQQAVRDRKRVWVGYVDAHGSPVSRLVRPVSMGAGFLRAEDERSETVHTFALHRITAAQLAEE